MKKCLLVLLPVLMGLTSCSGAQAKPANDYFARNDLIVEDTMAHEEIFGSAEVIRDLKPRQMNDVGTEASLKMGYQIQFDDKGTTSGDGYDEDDTISIRFIAAVMNLDVRAYWSRAIADYNGNAGVNIGGVWKYKLDDGSTHESTTLYKTLTNGLDTVTVEGEGP